MNERELIARIARVFPRSARQKNAPFECDAELIEMGNQLWALSIDEFTPAEDRFMNVEPRLLGANLVTATLSDLLAAGAEPEFFLQALALPGNVGGEYVDALAGGMREALADAGCFMCGGDIGTADSWRFCGTAIGRVPGSKPLTRRIPAAPHGLWVTGTLGDANAAALNGEPVPRFELRTAEALFARQQATACIDTSGGFLDAVWCLHACNPGLRFEIHIDRVPFAPQVDALTGGTDIPPEAALLGGAGEYELLFALPQSVCQAPATRVGLVVPDSEPGVFLTRQDRDPVRMPAPPPDPRQATDAREHARQVIAAAAGWFSP